MPRVGLLAIQWKVFPEEGLLASSLSAAHRVKSREWGRLKAKLEPLLT